MLAALKEFGTEHPSSAPSYGLEHPLPWPGVRAASQRELLSGARRRVYNDAPMRRCADAPMRRCADAPMRRCADAPMRRCADAPMRRVRVRCHADRLASDRDCRSDGGGSSPLPDVLPPRQSTLTVCRRSDARRNLRPPCTPFTSNLAPVPAQLRADCGQPPTSGGEP